jgi:hypothetical protein
LLSVAPPEGQRPQPRAVDFSALLPPPLPENWNALLQAIGFFAGPTSTVGELPPTLRRRDPYSRVR